MVKQGDIIRVCLDPHAGHEQAGWRPALVISNNEFMKRTKLAIVCPITNTDNGFPLHIKLDTRTQTTGVVLCEHVRTLDLRARKSKIIESVPVDILKQVTDIVSAETEMICRSPTGTDKKIPRHSCPGDLKLLIQAVRVSALVIVDDELDSLSGLFILALLVLGSSISCFLNVNQDTGQEEDYGNNDNNHHLQDRDDDTCNGKALAGCTGLLNSVDTDDRQDQAEKARQKERADQTRDTNTVRTLLRLCLILCLSVIDRCRLRLRCRLRIIRLCCRLRCFVRRRSKLGIIIYRSIK